jgi:hypothetical protein
MLVILFQMLDLSQKPKPIKLDWVFLVNWRRLRSIFG